MTNADKIRQMTDDELQDWLCSNLDCTECKKMRNVNIRKICNTGIFKWLQKECD